MKKTIHVALAFSILATFACILVAYAIGDRDVFWHQLKWKSANISHYRFQTIQQSIYALATAQMMGAASTAGGMGWNVEVQNGHVVSMTDKKGTAITSENENYGRITIDGLFSTVRKLKGEADEVIVTYDLIYGFPVEIRVDPSKDTLDEEWILSVSGFEVLP